MLTNFEFLKEKAQFNNFTNACLEAEKSLQVSPATCAILTRRALELSVKWLFTFDSALKVPYQDNISSLIHDRTFLNVIDEKLFPLLKYIIKLGNVAVHTNSAISRDEAVLALQNLHQFIDWLDYCYSDNYSESEFKEELLLSGEEQRKRPEEYQELYEKLSSKDRRLEDLIKENESLRKKLTKVRVNHTKKYHFQVNELSEYDTRKIYIDLDLKLAGWEFGKNVIEEYEVNGMPNSQGIGFVDYVLLGDNGKPIAVVEAKKTSRDPKVGKQQAKLYADCIEPMHGQRPIIFYTNGFETRLWDDIFYPERIVSGFYTKADLQLLIDRRTIQTSLTDIEINDNVTNRYYQKAAILSVCEALTQKQRKALLVMATGSGKTRVAVSIVEVLVRHNWVKNVLFLADRTALVLQAKKNFNNLLPNMTLCNLLDSKDSPELSRMVFSTYPTMMNAIDTKRKDGNKLFTVGHFDLIIVDESHRSIYKKYKAIFDYFDGIILGLTATPKDEIDKNTYDVFGLETGAPTFAYELEQAVKDEFLVDYRTKESSSKILDDGLRYDELSEEEKEQYEETFDELEGNEISSSAVNQWLFNDNTIDQVLNDLMENGIKVEGGDKLGKTIIFANNSKHAKRIVERFNALYPHYNGKFAAQIDFSINYVQTLIDDFSTMEKSPQIAVSVDMLDTGVDIPEVVNLVFFKKVRSKSKFWQMIGRGTRLCPDLFGIGEDKKYFLIFDYLRNFEFFRANQRGSEGAVVKGLTERIFNLKVDIIKELQGLEYQQDEKYVQHRSELVEDVKNEINRLNEDNFTVRMHLQFVHKYKNPANWQALLVTNVSEIQEHISPLIISISDNELAKRFDNVMYSIELANLTAKNAGKPIKSVVKTAEQLSKIGTIPQINEKREIINKVQTDEFWEEASIFELEEVREAIRELVKFLEKEHQKDYYTNFNDVFTTIGVDEEPFYGANDLKNYRKKVNKYLKEHQDELAVYKLRNNKPLTYQDVRSLEKVLWTELGTQEDYKKEFGETPITKLIRQIVGLDQQAANEAFSEFLSEERLNINQIKFVKLIIDYVVKNGMLEKKVLQEDPFRSLGSITELFRENISDVRKIIQTIDDINRNAEEFAGA